MSKEGLHSPAVENAGDLGTGPSSKGDPAETSAIDRETSFAQQRLWFLDQLEPGNPAYNDQITVALKGSLDVEALEAGLTEIAKRHETLRTRFAMRGGEPRQLVSPVGRPRRPSTVSISRKDRCFGRFFSVWTNRSRTTS